MFFFFCCTGNHAMSQRQSSVLCSHRNLQCYYAIKDPSSYFCFTTLTDNFQMTAYPLDFRLKLTIYCCPTSKLFSHLSAHMVNRLLCENRKSIPKSFNGKKLLKNITLQIFKIYLGKLSNKRFLLRGNVNFVCVFTALNNTKKKQRKFSITSY